MKDCIEDLVGNCTENYPGYCIVVCFEYYTEVHSEDGSEDCTEHYTEDCSRDHTVDCTVNETEYCIESCTEGAESTVHDTFSKCFYKNSARVL